MTRAIFIVGMAVGKTRLREFLKQGGYAGPIYTSNTKPYSDKLDTAEGGVVTIGSRDVILEIENAHTLDEYQSGIEE